MKGNGKNGKAHRLNERQAKFARGVASGKSATQAAKDAGYGKQYAGRFAAQLLEKPLVQSYLTELNAKIASPDIADASKRQRFWTAVMEDTKTEMKDRLRASELLAKSQGDFIERHAGPNGEPLPGAQVHVHLSDNGRGLAPPVVANGRNGHR